MDKKKYDIAAAYRIYPKVSKVPPVFSDDKYLLSELCFKSFANAFADLRVKLFVILDSCPENYKNIFRDNWKEGIEFIDMKSAGNPITFKKQSDVLASQDFADWVYFAEDDYFYLPNALDKTYHFLKKNADADFASAYDHPDIYRSDLHTYPREKKVFDGYTWQSVGSACMTFMTSRNNLLKTKNIFDTYAKKNYDASLWFSLTKKIMKNIPVSLKLFFTDREAARIFLKMWYFGLFQILYRKKYTLWTPIPSLATHMDSEKLAPGYDWHSLFSLKPAEYSKKTH